MSGSVQVWTSKKRFADARRNDLHLFLADVGNPLILHLGLCMGLFVSLRSDSAKCSICLLHVVDGSRLQKRLASQSVSANLKSVPWVATCFVASQPMAFNSHRIPPSGGS